jgi:hypothetical protein
MEARRPTKENIEQTTAPRTQSRISASSGLLGVREVARKDKRTGFTMLLHHVTVALLWDSFHALKREASPPLPDQAKDALVGNLTVTWAAERNGRTNGACQRQYLARSATTPTRSLR